jgi:hypothetical protein
VTEETLAPEIVEQLRQQLLQEHPEMAGAEVTVAPRRHHAETVAVAAKVGAVAVGQPAEKHYTVTLRKEVEAEDGVKIPLVVRVTVDAQGREVKRRQAR